MTTARQPKYYQNKKLGFTLIELLVVIGIIMTTLGLSLVGYIRFNDRQQVRETAKQIQTMLRTAQAKAQVREVPVETTCNRLNGFRVVRTNASAVTLQSNCDASVFNTRDSYLLPTGITMNHTYNYAEYEALSGRAVLKNELGATVSTLTITVTNGTTSYSFLVESGGGITEGNFD